MDVDTTTPKWIELDGAHNVRDLGGLPTATGVRRPGILVRADALDALRRTPMSLGSETSSA